jgi:threonine/homoserine/homoserine lactone efflux protein
MNHLLKGFRFGMLLQLAVGPMCLLVFQTASKEGFWKGFILVLAISLIDACYIGLSALGASKALKKQSVQATLKVISAMILIVFGMNISLGALGYSILPSVALFHGSDSSNLILKGILLTASNPLTIIFWSGVFAGQVLEHKFNKTQVLKFGIGCVLSTLCFLSAIAGIGSAVNVFLSNKMITILNFIVGLVIIGFGLKLLMKSDKNK